VIEEFHRWGRDGGGDPELHWIDESRVETISSPVGTPSRLDGTRSKDRILSVEHGAVDLPDYAMLEAMLRRFVELTR
jgi:hypothetical protein